MSISMIIGRAVTVAGRAEGPAVSKGVDDDGVGEVDDEGAEVSKGTCTEGDGSERGNPNLNLSPDPSPTMRAILRSCPSGRFPVKSSEVISKPRSDSSEESE
mmetsp:Transcript_8319/g.10397  ORF Transcript_8319/g.10397 Transcript_8319/m.10397 type:complete len:102 (-) Transcript_8319:485-790(-)